MSSFVDRMVGAARLDVATYEEVEADRDATGQAAGVVVLASVAAGVGTIGQAGVLQGLVGGILAGLLGWLVWATLTWAIGTKLLPVPATQADIGELLRTIGFATAPGILRIGGIIPVLGPLIMLVATVWMLVAAVIGVRQALDYESTWRAVGVCVIGWVVLVVIQGLLVWMFGGGGAGDVPAQ